MNFQMNPNSLFAILLRSPWWVSFVVALGVVLLALLAYGLRLSTADPPIRSEK